MASDPMPPAIEQDIDARLRERIEAISFELRWLRLTLFCSHQEAFEGPRPMCTFDPTRWMARALDDHIVCLLHTLSLYREADWCFHEGLDALE